MLNREFNGLRLKEGRIYRGYTITELAECLNVSKQMISKYENGKSTPSFESLVKLTKVLKFPREYFYEKPVDIQVGNTYFRSLLSVGKKTREMQYDRVKYLTTIRTLLEEYVDFPHLDVPEFTENDLEDMDVLSRKLRNEWNIGNKPIKNIVLLLEQKGFVLSSLTLENNLIDAFGTHHEVNGKEYYSIILGNNKKSYYRRQFDLAHELGHKILHDPYINLNDLSKEEFKTMEQEANDFAAAFLLPKEEFIKDVSMYPSNLEYYKILKKKWNVSIGAMVMRAYKLGVINEGSYHYLQRVISSKGWRKKEPLDDIKELNAPIGMKQAVELLIENNYITSNDLISHLSQKYGLSLFSFEIENLIGLDKGYLGTTEIHHKDNIVNLSDVIKRKESN